MKTTTVIPGTAPRKSGPREHIIVVALVVPEEFEGIAPAGHLMAIRPVLRALRNRLALENLLVEELASGCGPSINCSAYIFAVSRLQDALDVALDEVREMEWKQFAVIGWYDGAEGLWMPHHPKQPAIDLHHVVEFARSDTVLKFIEIQLKRLREQKEPPTKE